MKEPPHTDMSTPTTFEAHGHTWTKHTPGNPMPCKPDTLIFTLFKCEFEKGIIEVPASNPDKWKWQEIDDDYSIIGWRFATPPQEKGELTILRIRLEDAETVIEDIASDVAEFAADGDSPNAGPRDRLAAKVFSHISAHRASAPDSKLSWKDKQNLSTKQKAN